MSHRSASISIPLIAVLAATALAAVPAAAQDDADGPASAEIQVISSPDGSLTLELDQSIDASGITVSMRTPDEFPEDLDWSQPVPFIEIEPHAAVFDPPARLTRRLPVEALGLDPATQPVPLGVLAIGVPRENWTWAQDATFTIDHEQAQLVLGGSVSRGGMAITFVGGGVLTDLSSLADVAVGDSAIIETVLELPAGAAATLSDAGSESSDESVAAPGETFLAPLFGDQVASHHFSCVAPGTATVATSDRIDDYALENPFALAVGLAGTTVHVLAEGEVTCSAP